MFKTKFTSSNVSFIPNLIEDPAVMTPDFSEPQILKGEDGFSPIINIQENSDGYILTITDKENTKSIQIKNGKDGLQGEPGVITDEDKKAVIEIINTTVENKQEPLLQRIQNLEATNLDYISQHQIAQEVRVPNNSGPYAFITEIHGRNAHALGTNLLNPELVTFVGDFSDNNIGYEYDWNTYTYTFTVKYAEHGFKARFYLDYRWFEAGKYGVYASMEDNGGSIFFDILNSAHTGKINFYLPEDPGSENGYYADEATFKVKLMIYKIDNSNTVEFEEAPPDTPFEPFAPQFASIGCSSVDSIDINNLTTIDSMSFPWDFWYMDECELLQFGYDENGKYKVSYIPKIYGEEYTEDVTNLFTRNNAIKVSPGGYLRFNSPYVGAQVQSVVQFVTMKRQI